MSSIPQTYTDLLIGFSLRSDYGLVHHEGQHTFNSVSTGYAQVLLVGANSSANSYGQSGQPIATWSLAINGGGSTANTFSNGEIYFPNYSSTSITKSWSTTAVTENNTSNAAGFMVSGFNTSTAAISSLTFYAWQNFINFAVGSTFYLYGIS
jgi:hypothetical protein